MSDFKYGKPTSLLPELGIWTTIAIVVGAVVGSGIFKKTAYMSYYTGSPEIIIIIWIVTGIITLFGALTNAEISSMIPKTGGQYIYFQKMYGDFIAFLYGWAIFIVIQTGSIASITYIFSETANYYLHFPKFPLTIEQGIYLYIPFIGSIYPLKDFGIKLFTIFIILFLTTVNYFGVKFGGRLSAVFTLAKVLAIIIIVLIVTLFGTGDFSNFYVDASSSTIYKGSILSGITYGIMAAFWAYDGWNNITYIGEEVKNSKRTIPIALISGTIIVIIVYLLINFAYIYVLPVEKMANIYSANRTSVIAYEVVNIAIGSIGSALVTIAILLSTFGTSNGTIMVSARVYFAMSREGLFFNSIGKIHNKFRTPANALILQGVWASLLVISGSFDDLTDMLIFVSFIFYGLGAYGVFVLRRKMPNAPRPYKVIGYPFIPIIFIVFSFLFVILTLYFDIENYLKGETKIINSIFGLFLVFLGIPFYIYFKKKRIIEKTDI